MNFPVNMVNGEIQTTTFPIEYTVEPEKLYNGSIKIHISKINDTPRIPAIALVVNDITNGVSSHNLNPITISINDDKYAPVKIIPTASV